MNNIKRVIFDIKSSKNIFWDDTPIRVGAQLVICLLYTSDAADE